MISAQMRARSSEGSEGNGCTVSDAGCTGGDAGTAGAPFPEDPEGGRCEGGGGGDGRAARSGADGCRSSDTDSGASRNGSDGWSAGTGTGFGADFDVDLALGITNSLGKTGPGKPVNDYMLRHARPKALVLTTSGNLTAYPIPGTASYEGKSSNARARPHTATGTRTPAADIILPVLMARNGRPAPSLRGPGPAPPLREINNPRSWRPLLRLRPSSRHDRRCRQGRSTVARLVLATLRSHSPSRHQASRPHGNSARNGQRTTASTVT